MFKLSYLAATNQSKTGGFSELYRRLPLVYSAFTGVQDTVVLAAIGVGGTSNGVGQITFQEIF